MKIRGVQFWQMTGTIGNMSAAWWACGRSGSCDCNRDSCIPSREDEGDEHDDGEPITDECCGCMRYLIIDATGPMNGYTIADINNEYPLSLCRKHPESMRGADGNNMRRWQRNG